MLGLCCHFLKEETRPKSRRTELVNAMEEKTLQLGKYKTGKYSAEQIKGTYINNVHRLSQMLPYIGSHGIRLFRISSGLFPLADQVDKSLWDNDEVKFYLREVGDYIKKTGMRVSTHPGQFCVLSSDSDKVVENAFKELAMHGWVFDMMGLDHSPQYAINIHGGKKDRTSRLVEQIKSLPDNVRKRLTLENDETAYNVIDLLHVHKATGTPIVWDSHHHTFNDGDLTPAEAFEVTRETWQNGIRPLQHISNTEPSLINGNFQDRRKHSDMIHYIPDVQLQALRDDTIDAEIEAKHKNYAVFDMSRRFCLPL